MSITRINSLGITDGTIVNGDINASAGITLAKLTGVNDAKAWVNFNGTGTVAIRGSFNVSSITDIGTGNYTVNFTTAMTDANYSTTMTASAGPGYGNLTKIDSGSYLVGSFTLHSTSSSAFQDSDIVCAAIFR